MGTFAKFCSGNRQRRINGAILVRADLFHSSRGRRFNRNRPIDFDSRPACLCADWNGFGGASSAAAPTDSGPHGPIDRPIGELQADHLVYRGKLLGLVNACIFMHLVEQVGREKF